MSLDREKYYSVRYTISDPVAFKAIRQKLCDSHMSDTPIDGARVTALSIEDVFSYDRFSLYLLDYIDNGYDKDRDPPLDHDEWLANGEPNTHDESAEYKRKGDEV